MAEKKPTVTVKPGDSMSAIAAKAGVSLAAMKAANPQVANPSLIKPNQVLNLPTPKAATPAKAAAAPVFNNDPATIALQRLQSGQTLTPEQRTLLGMGNPSTSSTATSTSTSSTSTSTSSTSTSTSTASTSASGVTTYTADDGSKFTDQNAFVNYQAMLRANATNNYNAAQAAAAKTAEDQATKRDAFALIQDTMKSFGFTDTEVAQLTAFAETQIMDVNIGPNQGILNMKALPVYQARFSGNQTRLKAGKNALSEADYLAQENAYGEYMKAYGVQSLGTRDQYATLIGNDVSATELNKRLNLAVDRVKNSDPEILKQLKTYYPSITDSDLVTYFLKPADALPDLEKKVATSEISAAAVGQGFAADMTGAAALQAFGVTREKALTGYQDIKTVLPVSERLAKIYGEAGLTYDRAAGEAEFLKNNADAAERRRRLKELERGSFSGQSGVERGTSLSQSTQGKF
jgi:hypothetical protein